MKSKHWHPFDSSKTRVCPAFRVVEKDPLSFFKLLNDEFNLGVQPEDVELKEIAYADEECGRKEQSLNPNPAYLKWLLTHPERTRIREKLSCKSNPTETDRERLTLLTSGSNLRDGLRGIQSCEERNVYGKEWYVLEGATKPDVFIKTNRFYLIVEGKRTEGGPDIGTSWDSHRHQMVRHLEGLREYREKNGDFLPIYGMFLARSRDRQKFDIYKSRNPYVDSLPHISDEQGAAVDKKVFLQIRRAYLGLVSWESLNAAYKGRIQYISHILDNGVKVPYEEYVEDE